MAYRFVEHTADVALEATAPDLGALFADALRGMTDCITEVERVEPRARRELASAAADLEQLLVDWLSEALYLFDTEGLLFCGAEAEVEELDSGFRIAAAAAGEPFDPRRHPLKVPIKAITYHGLRIERRDAAWRARIVFDI